MNLPPIIATRSRSKLSIDRSADSTLVAFESLTNRTPPTSATSSIACSRPRNDSTAAVIAAGAAPASAPTVARRHDVVDQVRPEQMDGAERHQSIRAIHAAIDDPAVLDDRPVRERGLCREQPRARAAAPRQCEHRRIVRVDHRPIHSGLVLENPSLRRCVRLDARMAIEVIRREVQHHGDPRVERLDLLELKAARLDDVERLGRRLVDLRAERRADVSADRHLEARRLEDSPRQHRRRRLAFRPGDRDHAPLQPPRRQLDLRDHRHAAIARRLQRRLLERHAWTQDHQIGIRERAALMTTELERDAERLQRSPSPAPTRGSPTSVTRAPRRASSSAAASPLRAAPTTTTRLFVTSNISCARGAPPPLANPESQFLNPVIEASTSPD